MDFRALFGPDRPSAEVELQRLRHFLIRTFEWGRYGDPEDLADETILRALKLYRDERAKGTDFSSYVVGIARNVHREECRSQCRERRSGLEPGEGRTAPPRLDETIYVRQLVAKLDPADRVLVLDYMSGEVSGARSQVRVRLHRAIKKLKKIARA